MGASGHLPIWRAAEAPPDGGYSQPGSSGRADHRLQASTRDAVAGMQDERGGELPWYLEKSVVQRALERKDRGGPLCLIRQEYMLWGSK